MRDGSDVYELEQLAVQPGTYFNPQTEVVIVVDDSATVDQDLFDGSSYEGASWVRVSDEVPVDETGLEEALDEFKPAGAGDAASATSLEMPSEGVIEDEDNPELEPDPDPDSEI